MLQRRQRDSKKGREFRGLAAQLSYAGTQMRLAAAIFGFCVFLPAAPAQTRFSSENAYNPIPSPDGKKIVAVRTGWHRPGGSGGLGRSNLRSDVIVLDRAGRLLSANSLADRFVADWKPEGIVLFRDWSYSLIGDDGRIRQQGRVCPIQSSPARISACVERVAYLSTAGNFVWVRPKPGDSVLVTPAGELSPHHREGELGEWVTPSPDERFIAAGPSRRGESLSVYDLRTKTWFDLGRILIHPDDAWNWMEPSWNPSFPDNSQLAFFTAEGLTVSTPNGKRRRVLLNPGEPSGLAVPSPDGRAIAYATFASRVRQDGGGNSPVWNCTGIWMVRLDDPTHSRRVTGPAPASTYDLRWLDNENPVFDRIERGFPPKAELWTVAAGR
jgi:hypothetical protein